MLQFRTLLSPLGLVAVLGAGTGSALAHETDATTTSLTRLGKVEFAVSCSGAAQQQFNRAMALYHSFAWPHATVAFETVAKTDPNCGMAHWGRAMTMLDNPFVWPANLAPQKLNDIAASLDAAKAAGLASQREQDYVAAVGAFVADRDKLNHRTRVEAFEAAMGKLAASYPDDTEASILHALVTSANFNPTDKTYANQLKAARILEPIFAAKPDHPGVAHYLIHSYDYPAIAKHGLAAARKYASIAPDAPHAQHMPSHIFTRLGYWEESIVANRGSAKAGGEATYDSRHAIDYMVYAHLQLAQDRAAQDMMDQSLAMKPNDHFAAAYAYAAMPARVALERGEWKAAASVPLKPESYPWAKYPQAEAVNAFARGIGAAKIGDAAAARTEQARLMKLSGAAKEAKIAYWADQIEIQAELVGALVLCADGKTGDCIDALGKVAAREDATEKHVVTPGPVLPAREILAEVLLDNGKAREALREYEAVLAKEPNRYRAVAGTMLAAERAGEADKARSYAVMLVTQSAKADVERPTLAQARRLAVAK